MPSLFPGYEYDIFISYRQKDNRSDQWVTNFILALQEELDATFKEDISIYFDANPTEGLHDHHEVDGSLAKKLKCLLFIPIVSRTYCDTNSFAWNKEFKVFVEQARQDSLGLKVNVAGGNVANRVLPIRIHELEPEDILLFESEIEGIMRPIDFIYKEAGVNRPLLPSHERRDNLANTDYGNQINKVANAIKEVISGIKNSTKSETIESETTNAIPVKKPFNKELKRRNVIRTSVVYILFALVLWKVMDIGGDLFDLTENLIRIITLGLIILFPISMFMAWLYERSPQGFIRTGSVESLNNPFSDEQKKPLTSNTFIGLLVVTAIALFVLFPNSISHSTSSPSDLDKSIAVLPFANLSNDPEQQFFADGVMEDILTQLQRMGELKVTSKTSVEQYRSTTKRVSDIGNELKVSYLLEGSVRKSDDQIMITAQLIRTGDDSHIWANNFTSDYTTKGLFDIQRKIAENIVRELSLKISPIELKKIIHAQTDNKEAYEHFQKGKQMYRLYTGSDNEIAIQQLRQAIQKDPSYAAAYGALANALIKKFNFGYSRNWIDSGRTYAKHGLKIDSLCAECYKALGLGGNQVKQALAYYEKAISIDPNYLEPLSNAIPLYVSTGNIKKAFENLKRIENIDRFEYVYNLARLYRILGNYELSASIFQKYIRQDENVLNNLIINYLRLGEINKLTRAIRYNLDVTGDSSEFVSDKLKLLWKQKKYKEVIGQYEHMAPAQTSQISECAADSFFKIGEVNKSKKICVEHIKEIFSSYDNQPEMIEGSITMTSLATLYSIYNEKEQALFWMKKAIEKGYYEPFEESFFDNIRDETRFQELVKIQDKKRADALVLMATYHFPKPEDM